MFLFSDKSYFLRNPIFSYTQSFFTTSVAAAKLLHEIFLTQILASDHVTAAAAAATATATAIAPASSS